MRARSFRRPFRGFTERSCRTFSILSTRAAGSGFPSTASITAAARVTRVAHAATPGELLAHCAGHQGEPLARLRTLLEGGAVTVIDLQWLGRLARPLSVSALIEREVIGSTPSAAVRLAPEGWQRIVPELALA